MIPNIPIIKQKFGNGYLMYLATIPYNKMVIDPINISP